MTMAAKKYPVFWYYGGKHYLLEKLLELLPPHKYYAELFGGAGSLLIYKPPAKVEVYNDVNNHLTNFFQVLRSPVYSKILIERLKLTPYSEQEFEQCKLPIDSVSENEWYDPTLELSREEQKQIEEARRWYTQCCQSFNGAGISWSFPARKTPRNRARHFQRLVEQLKQHGERLRNVIICNRNAIELIPEFDEADWLIYLDPPYHPDTRGQANVYMYELRDEEHKTLVEKLLQIKHASVMLSGYDHPTYDPLIDAGWKKHTIEIARRAGGKSNDRAQEIIWIRTNDQPAAGTLFEEFEENA